MGNAVDRSYIKTFRNILTWEWYGDTNTFRVFMHILLTANYTPKNYKGQIIGAGECVFGRKAWAEKLGLSEQQVRTAISHLQSTNEITTRATNQFTIIRVEKWDFWQINNGIATNEATNEIIEIQPTDNQRVTTPKERKKVINKKNISNSSGKRIQDMTREEKDAFLSGARSRLNLITCQE